MNKRLHGILFISFWLVVACAAAQEGYRFDTLSTSNETDSEKRGRFTTIAPTATVEVRKLPQEKIERLKKSEDYWYANLEPEKKDPAKAQPKKQNSNLFSQAWFQNLLWIVILCSFIGVVVWYLAASNINLFRQKSKTFYTDEPGAETADDIFSIQYEKEIAKAEATENFQVATRLWYLKTLKALSEKNQIVYSPERPDGDYVAALNGSNYYHDFFRLTRVFEYTWYGQFPLSSEAYSKLKIDFQNFQSSLPV